MSTDKPAILPKIDVPCTKSRLAELLTSSNSSKEPRAAPKRPANKRGRKPRNAAPPQSTESILRGLLEGRSSRASNSPLFDVGAGSRSPGSGSSASLAGSDCGGFAGLGPSTPETMTNGVDEADVHDHGLLTNFYASFLGPDLSGEVTVHF